MRVALVLSGALVGAGLLVTARGSAAQAAAAGESLAAVKARIADLERRVGDGQGPARTRACKTNSEGVCVYTEKEAKARKQAGAAAPPVDPDAQALIAAYEAFLADPAGAAAPEAAAYRYHLAWLLADAGEVARARPHLERLTDGSDASPRAAWAATLLVDVLVRAWTEGAPAQRAEAGEALRSALARLRVTAVWSTDAAKALRGTVPMIEAGLRWARAIEHLERGKAADEPHAAAAAFFACGREFRAIHAEYADRHDRADALLWNAAMCFDAAREPEEALRLFAVVVERYPHGPFAEKALMNGAEILDALARYGEAAEWYEQLAATHPRSYRAADALGRAVTLRAALGPRERLEAGLTAYEAMYARTDPRRAAEIRWAGYAWLPQDDAARRAYVERFLVDHGKRAAPTLWLAASAEHARLLVRETCPKGLMMESLCLTAAPGPSVSIGLTNGPPAPVVTTRWSSSRGGPRYEAALQEAASVRAYARRRGRELPVEPAPVVAAEAVAAAALMQADAALEAILAGRRRPPLRGPLYLTVEEATSAATPDAVVPPTRLGLARYAGLRDAAAEDVDAIDEAYVVIERLFRDSAAALRAHARRGLLREWLVDRALLAIAAGARGVERSDILILRAGAIVQYRRCLELGPAMLAAGESAAHCERRLAALSRHEPRIVAELVGDEAPGYPATRPDVAGVVLDADEATRVGAWLSSEGADEPVP